MEYRMFSLVFLTFCCLLPLTVCAGRQMPKLSDKKLCADSECSHPILIARAIEDFYPQDCRFIPIRKGQVIYVYSMLKDRGNLFWAGSVQGSYYGEQEARLGHFPRSVVEETHALMPATEEVKTDALREKHARFLAICLNWIPLRPAVFPTPATEQTLKIT